MFKSVYGHCLDKGKHWYPYNKSLPGYQKNGSPEASKTFQCFETEVKKVKLADLRDAEGHSISHRHFFAGARKVKDVYVLSSLGVVVLSLRHAAVGWLETDIGKYVGSVVNSVALDYIKMGAQEDNHVNGDVNRRNMAMAVDQITVLESTITKQQIRIESLDAHRCQKRARTPEYCELSTRALLLSTEITPPEKQLRIKQKANRFISAIKKVAVEEREDLRDVLGIMTVEGDTFCSEVLIGATDIVFSNLGAQRAMKKVLSTRSQSILVESIRMPDWVYLLLKVRIRISDAAWQTLLNLTQLGRTGVSCPIFLFCYL